MIDWMKLTDEQRAELWRAAWIADGLSFGILDQARWPSVDRERLAHFRAELRRAADIIDGVMREQGATDDD